MTHRTGLGRLGPWLPHLGAVPVLAICFADGARTYGSLPDMVPVHWGLDGPDAWEQKSVGVVFMAPLVALGTAVLLALVSAAAPALSPEEPGASQWEAFRREAAGRGIHPTEPQKTEEAKWIAGVLRNDPENPQVLVPKRKGTGTGLTVNVGNARGRTAVVLFLIAVIGLPVGLGELSALGT